MVVFRPFRGCRYNPEVVGDMAAILCPPYDIIGPELKESLKARSPYNAVHLEGGEQPDPVAPEESYRRAAALFRQWLGQGVLKRDSEPCFYLMRHRYQYRGQSRSQVGLFGDIQVEDYDSGGVFPHEFTREPAVLDRVALLDACRAQFSPIMSLYRDAEGQLRPLLEQAMSEEPALSVSGGANDDVAFWQISSATAQENISRFFSDRPVFLADGHHRYEAALRYRRRQSSGDASPAADAAHNYVTMALIEFDDPGLLLLPYHRVVGGLSPDALGGIKAKLSELFEVQPAPPEQSIGALLDQVHTLGQQGHALAVVGLDGNVPSLLTLRREVDWRQWGELAVSEAWILEEQVIRPLLGEATAQHIDYTHDHDAAVSQVASGERQLACLLRPFPMDTFESIVGGGQRLPSKSTFFYPKLPTGLVINQLEGAI